MAEWVLKSGCHAEHSLVEHSLVEHSLVEHSLVEHSLVEHSLVEHSLVEHSGGTLSGGTLSGGTLCLRSITPGHGTIFFLMGRRHTRSYSTQMAENSSNTKSAKAEHVLVLIPAVSTMSLHALELFLVICDVESLCTKLPYARLHH